MSNNTRWFSRLLREYHSARVPQYGTVHTPKDQSNAQLPNLDSGDAKLRLVPGWKTKLTKWWSMQVAWFGIVFWSAMAGLWVIWPAFVEKIPLWAYAVGGIAMSVALGVAWILKQPGLD